MSFEFEEDGGDRMTIRRAEDVAWRRIDRETVVVHLTRHWMYALNESGGKLWETLAEPVDGEQLEQILSDSAATVFLADLAAEGLIESDFPLPASSAPLSAANHRESPRIEWREEVRRFAGGCAHFSGQSTGCNINPGFS
jgi:hypothetical protein